ncbi:MAG: SRPBCC family protein [Pirellulaceae bacterium]
MVKKILLWTAAILAVLIIGFLVVVAMQPDDFVITRSATIDAPPADVFPHVNDLHQWQAWSPWAKLDPSAKNTFEGPSAGAGAAFSWSGNDKIGEGKMTITESKPNELVRMKLEFVRPMEDKADTDFVLAPAGGKTDLTWTMAGKNNFMGKAFCLFMDMDAMVGGDFEEGLANLKKIVEVEQTTTDKGEKPVSSDEVPVGNE